MADQIWRVRKKPSFCCFYIQTFSKIISHLPFFQVKSCFCPGRKFNFETCRVSGDVVTKNIAVQWKKWQVIDNLSALSLVLFWFPCFYCKGAESFQDINFLAKKVTQVIKGLCPNVHQTFILWRILNNIQKHLYTSYEHLLGWERW